MSPVYFFIADASPLFLFGDAGFTMHSFSDVPDSISQGVRDDTSCNRACSQVFLASCPDVRADQGSTAASYVLSNIYSNFWLILAQAVEEALRKVFGRILQNSPTFEKESLNFAQSLMNFCRNSANIFENVEKI